MQFHQKLRQLMDAAGLDGAEVGRAVGASHTSVYRWLEAESRPKLDVALRLARLFGVRLDDLADDDRAAHAPTPEERVILEFARSLGTAEAIRRLATPPGAPAADDPPALYPRRLIRPPVHATIGTPPTAPPGRPPVRPAPDRSPRRSTG